MIVRFFRGDLRGFEIHLGDEGASCINHTEENGPWLPGERWDDTMGTETGRNWKGLLQWFRGTNIRRAAEFFHNVGVVGRFVMHVDSAPP